MRSQKASAVLVVLGCLAGLLAHVGLWARFVVFDEDGFSRAVVRATASSEVRSDLRAAIVEEVIEGAEPRLIAARPLVEGAVDSVLTSEAFSRAIEAAAKDLHRSVFDEDAPTITLQVTQLVGRARTLVRSADPELADAPGWEKAERLPIASESYIDQARAIDDYVRTVTILCTTVSIGALGAALWLSPSRRNAMIDIGVGIIAVAGITLVLTALGATEVERRAPASVADTARSTFEVLTSGLRVSSFWLGAAGLLIIAGAAARSPGHPAPSLFAPVFIGRGWIAGRARKLHPIARSLAMIGGGIALMYWHQAFVDLLVVAAGAWIMFVGLYGLLEVLGRYEERRTRLTVSPRSVWIGLTSVVAVIIAAGLLQSKAPGSPFAPPDSSCNGDVELCDKRVDEVVFPATHNSMAASSEDGWFSAYQKNGIPLQLRDGVRAFLIDTYHGREGPENIVFTDSPRRDRTTASDGLSEEDAARAESIRSSRSGAPRGERKVYLCHGFCELGATPLETVLGDVRSFLAGNPREVLILFIQDEVPPAEVAPVFEKARLTDRLYVHPPSAPWPTLGELVQSRKQIIVLSENFGPGPSWYQPGFMLAQDTPYEYPTVESFNCAPNRGVPEAPLLVANHWVAKLPPNPMEARRANSYEVLMNRARTCATERGKNPNILAVDFYSEGDLFEVAEVLNGLRPAR